VEKAVNSTDPIGRTDETRTKISREILADTRRKIIKIEVIKIVTIEMIAMIEMTATIVMTEMIETIAMTEMIAMIGTIAMKTKTMIIRKREVKIPSDYG
jgi:hypothetical protein